MRDLPKNKSQLATIFLITFLNMIGFGIIIPLLPYYAGSFGASPGTIGILIGSYAAAQFAGSPVWGRLSDRFGRRSVLLITTAIASIGYILFGLANSLLLLFISRILTGFMNGNISVAQALVSDITEKEERVKGYGLLGAAFGLGLVTGPALGGFLSNWSFAAAAYGAAVLNLLSMFAIYRYLPETRPESTKATLSENTFYSLPALRAVLKRPDVGAILQTRFVFSISFSTFATVFAIYAEYGLKLSAQTTAWMLTYVGLLMVLVQGLLITKLTRYLSESRLIYYSIILMGFSLIGWAFVRDIPLLLIMLIPLAIAGGIFNTVINSSLSKIVVESEVGGILGISASIESFTRILAPSVGGYLLAEIGLWAPGIFSALLLAALIPYAFRHFIKHPHPALSKVN